jgi:hypothetical protein
MPASLNYMRDSWLIALLLVALAGICLAGCATTSHARVAGAPRAIDESGDAKVAPAPPSQATALRIVEHKPSARRYRFVGVVRATSQSGDLVEAARDADADLRRQAARLHADVVKLDVIAPPNDTRAHRHLIFAGRAYKSIARN